MKKIQSVVCIFVFALMSFYPLPVVAAPIAIFQSPDQQNGEDEETEEDLEEEEDEPEEVEITVRKAQRGIIVVDSAGVVRAMSTFKTVPHNGANYAAAINRYRAEMPDSINIYSMVVPLAIAYYCPENSPLPTSNQADAIDIIYDALDEGVVPVDVFYALWDHRNEPIYSRTDHHWAPLGAYYAAEEFSDVAGVPFLSLESFEPDTVRNYVGTMYQFSKDRAVKNSPEDFVYYVPQDVAYKAEFITYRLDGKQRVTGESPLHEDEFFYHYKDGSVAAYSTFMGGDTRTVKVTTGIPNGRKLMIVKDSFGNAVAPALFGSFQEIYVVDFRYFNHSIKNYALQNGITDIIFINNLSHAYTPSTGAGLNRMLDCKD